MSHYIHFTEEQKEQARHTDIADMIIRQGETLKHSGTEYEWRDGYHKMTIRGNLWFNQYERIEGKTNDFVMKYFNKTYPEDVEYLIGESGGSLITSPAVEKKGCLSYRKEMVIYVECFIFIKSTREIKIS